MATTYYFLAAPEEQDVIDWFRNQTQTAEEYANDQRTLLFFRQFGPLAREPDERINTSASPLVSIYLPKVRRGELWTVGEVHFLTEDLRKSFPELEEIRRRFKEWLEEQPIAWERRKDEEEGGGYYLEGMTKNVAETIFAFPMGFAAFEAGRYFVSEHDSDAALDRICAKLRLRGVECA